MLGILSDVLKRATYLDDPRAGGSGIEMPGDWRPPVHWRRRAGDGTYRGPAGGRRHD